MWMSLDVAGYPAFSDSPDAACRTEDPLVFFPEGVGRRGASDRQAKAICRRCPLRTRCRDWALPINNLFGTWGGMTQSERAQWRAIQEAKE